MKPGKKLRRKFPKVGSCFPQRQKTVRASADTLESAFEKALSKVPPGANILKKEKLVDAKLEVVTLEVSDDEAARRQVEQKDVVHIENVKLVEPGKKGFLGIGKRLNRYEITAKHLAIVKVIYKGKTKIRITLGDKTTSKNKRLERLMGNRHRQRIGSIHRKRKDLGMWKISHQRCLKGSADHRIMERVNTWKL
jgi:hypothetical protein